MQIYCRVNDIFKLGMENLLSERLHFWDNRAGLGLAAGSNDVNLKNIEIKALDSVIPSQGNILDAGCGNGYTLTALAKDRKNAKMYGFDYSSAMIDEGNKLIEKNDLRESIFLKQSNLMDLQIQDLKVPQYDCIYTQRSLINLDSFADQQSAVMALWKLVKKGGSLVLCESFEDGLSQINEFRRSLRLEEIIRPWHNTYFSLQALPLLASSLGVSPQIIEFSGSYYFVSRVIHAWQAQSMNEQPSYSDPLNMISLQLPAISVCGQSKLIVFSKKAIS